MVTRPQETDQPADPFESNVEPVGAGETGFTSSGTTYVGGVNPNYKIPTTWRDPNNPNEPYKYTTDDLNIIYKLSTEKLAQVNKLLMKAFPGYKPTSLTNRFDSKLKSTFGKALSVLNVYIGDPNSPVAGKSIYDQLQFLSENPVFEAGTKLPTYRLDNPDDLKKVFTKASQSSLGRTISDDELDKLVKAYQQQSIEYQQRSAIGGTVTAPASADVFAEKQIRKQAPVEAEANDYLNYMGALSEWLQG